MAARRSGERRGRAAAVGVSLLAHLLGLALFLSARAPAPLVSVPVTVTLAAPTPDAPAASAPAKAPAAKAPAAHAAKVAAANPAAIKPQLIKTAPSVVRPLHRAAAIQAVEVEDAPAPSAELSTAQLAGAMTVGEGAASGGGSGGGAGGGGGGCDMGRLLQTALRKDPLVRAAVAGAHDPARSSGKAYLVWNGDWVRSGAEDGKGLAAVREAIMWAVAFAPAACRAAPVHGLVLMSLNDGPGSVRLALGTGDWRWSNLLGPGVQGR